MSQNEPQEKVEGPCRGLQPQSMPEAAHLGKPGPSCLAGAAWFISSGWSKRPISSVGITGLGKTG